MSDSVLGSRIREHRRQIGLTQAELARRLGISASYLNLIERNKRRIAGKLLTRVAEALGVTLDDLDGAAEQRLRGILDEIAHLPALGAVDIDTARTAELIGAFPDWARAIAALARAEREATERARKLSDRMAQDPFLGETVHRMLTRIASVRSASGILTGYPDLDAQDRSRFDAIVQEEAAVLSDIGEALAAYFDTAEETDRAMTPQDEVETLFEHRQNRFEEIETFVKKSSDSSGGLPPDSAAALITAEMEPTFARIIEGSAEIDTEAARNRTLTALREYAMRALTLPDAAFIETAARQRYDIETLAQTFGVDPGTIGRRLTALPRRDGIPVFGFFRANAAGTLIEMLALPGLSIPRYAAACPLWSLYRAQQRPEQVWRQRVVFPDGQRYVFVARASASAPEGFGKPRHYVTDMLTLSERDAALTVYAPGDGIAIEEVGPACQICPRQGCTHRVDDPFLAR